MSDSIELQTIFVLMEGHGVHVSRQAITYPRQQDEGYVAHPAAQALVHLLCNDKRLPLEKRGAVHVFRADQLRGTWCSVYQVGFREPRVIYHEDVGIVREKHEPRKHVDMIYLEVCIS